MTSSSLSSGRPAIAVLSDATYREEFLDVLQTSLRETFGDRARYLEARRAAAAPAPPAAPG